VSGAAWLWYGALASRHDAAFLDSHYRITSKLGAGGMCGVYRATDTELGRDVAIKILPADLEREA
jgi:serine/threonine protein kinase